MFKFSAVRSKRLNSNKRCRWPLVDFQRRTLSLKRKRPMVHLSSAPNQKYKGKSIGTSHPVSPHEITPRLKVPDHILKPAYAINGRIPPTTTCTKEPRLALHDSESIEKMRKSSQLAAEMLQRACSMIREGITTNEIDVKIHEAIINEGGYPSTLNYNGFPKSICSSVNEVACRGIPDMRPLKIGDLVSLDISVYLSGYHGENCRTVLVEEDNHNETKSSIRNDIDDHDHAVRAKALMEATEHALFEAINVCYAGIEISEIGRVTHHIAETNGFRPLKNICGHGVGSHLEMLPEVKHYRNKDTQVLEPGMVITIEPVLVEGHHAHVTWEDGWTLSSVDGGLAAQFEHTILINENGPPDILTLIYFSTYRNIHNTRVSKTSSFARAYARLWIFEGYFDTTTVCSLNVVPKSQTRRDALSSIAGALTIAPAVLPANAGQQDLYIPGVAGGAPFRNLVVDESTADDGAALWNPPAFVTNLGNSRILAKELSPLNPSLVPFVSDNELYYDKFLFGAWRATATLKRKVFPYGTNYLPSPSLYEGSPRNRAEMPGDTTSYEMHYFSPNTDGGKISEKSKIAADRVFNALSMSSAYKQLSQVKDVTWDFKKDPTRLTINFSSLAEDMQPLGQKRAEIYLTSRKSESGIEPNTGQPVFCASERLRSVVLVPGNVVVSDTETITEFQVVNGSDGDHVKATSRIAVYLTPNPNSREGILWQDVNGKAVAFFDYEIDLKRMVDVDPEGKKKVCLLSPSGATQCA